MIVAAWGTRGALLGRDVEVRGMLFDEGLELVALRLTKDGHPEHPLYIPYDVEPVRLPWPGDDDPRGDHG